jgi:hypothetical protein
MFRTVPSWSCSQAVSKPVWHIPLLCVQWKTPDDGQKNCLKHVEFHSKSKFQELVHLISFILRKVTVPVWFEFEVHTAIRKHEACWVFLFGPMFNMLPPSISNRNNCCIHSRNSIVRLQAVLPKSHGSIPDSDKRYYLLPIVQTGSGVHPASCRKDNGNFSLGVKAALLLSWPLTSV